MGNKRNDESKQAKKEKAIIELMLFFLFLFFFVTTSCQTAKILTVPQINKYNNIVDAMQVTLDLSLLELFPADTD